MRTNQRLIVFLALASCIAATTGCASARAFGNLRWIKLGGVWKLTDDFDAC